MKKIIYFTTLLILSLNVYALNFSVFPTGFRFSLDKVITEEVTITNSTSSPLRLEAFTESDLEFSEKYNINSNITVFPKTISIKPGERQIVRFRVKPTSDIGDGEYKSYLTFKEIPGKIKTTVPEKNVNGTNIAIQTEISIGIFGEKGTPNVKGSISAVSLTYNGTHLNLHFLSLSEGNTSIKFFYSLEILNSNLKSEGFLGISARNGEKEISLMMEAPEKLKGKKAKLVITDQDGKVYYDKVHTL